jgi:hypothetical protein
MIFNVVKMETYSENWKSGSGLRFCDSTLAVRKSQACPISWVQTTATPSHLSPKEEEQVRDALLVKSCKGDGLVFRILIDTCVWFDLARDY